MDSLDLVVRAHELSMSEEKERTWGCYSCANFLGKSSIFLCEHCVDKSNWRKVESEDNK